MGPLNLLLWLLGTGLIVIGSARVRGPWRRYRELKAADENVARYEAWRGGVRGSSPTGASAAMELLRRQIRTGAGIVVAGFLLVLFGFLVGQA